MHNDFESMPTRKEFVDDAMTNNVQQIRVRWGYLVGLVSLVAVHLMPAPASATSPVQQAYFEPDYQASGLVVPAGMPGPQAYHQAVQQTGFFGNAPIAARLGADCDASGCDAYCDANGCYGECGCAAGQCGCAARAGLLGGGLVGGGAGGFLGSGMRPMCLFCGSSGCGFCNSFGSGIGGRVLRSFLPYGQAGLAAQRWYDLSFDVMFLETTAAGGDLVLSTSDINGTPVLRARDAHDNDHEAGGRISGAFIVGPGGNIEVTYLGGNRWRNSALAEGQGDLYSFLSEFGTAPPAGFDDTDRSNWHRASTEATFHSGEVNYRRRTVGPYGRFQWSGLGGIRYLRYDSDVAFETNGGIDPNTSRLRYFSMENSMDNEMVGVQIGGDLWWNVIPGVNIGLGAKGGPMGNHITRKSYVEYNSLGPGGTPGQASYRDSDTETAWIGELEATLLYRISHSWTLKSQYYLLTVDEVGFGVDAGLAERELSGSTIDPIRTNSLTIKGFAFGAEYVW